MAAPPVNTPQVEKIFKDSTWQAQAERPDILGQLGAQWNAFLAGKGQGLKAYVRGSAAGLEVLARATRRPGQAAIYYTTVYKVFA